MIKTIFKAGVFLMMVSLSGTLGISREQQEQKVPRDFSSTEALLEYFHYNVHFFPDENIPEVSSREEEAPPTMVSEWGDMTIDGKKYIGRLIRTEKIATNANGIEDVKQICSLAPGQKIWTKETIQTCSTVKINANLGFTWKLSEVIGISLGLGIDVTKTKCYTIETGKEYSFPPNCNGYNSAIIYMGTRFDLHRVTMEIAPYEIRDSVALRDCLRTCNRIKEINQATICSNDCQKRYGFQPNLNKITTYYFTLLKPELTTWSYCLNI